VMSWNPPFCGDLDIRIARNGTWYYLGLPLEGLSWSNCSLQF
jgi:hypothetical protein